MPLLRLKKGEERRLRTGHLWIYSNEINTALTPLHHFKAGEEAVVLSHNQTPIGKAYVNPHSLIVGRIFSQDPDATLDLNFFITKFENANEFRQRLFDAPFYRLIFGEADEIPGLIVDRYDQHFVCQLNTAGIDRCRENIIAALKIVFPNVQSIFFKGDSTREYEGLTKIAEVAFGEPPSEIQLIENTTKFLVPLLEGQKTGWFFDHRLNRARLKDYVKDRSVLDVFSYLGAFGIQAALYGAKTVDMIEASTLACEYIRKNAVLNQVEKKCHVICEDAFDALKNLRHSQKLYDVIVLDPPAFIKKRKDYREGLIAYQRINELALNLLASNGILVSCSCSMHLSREDLHQCLQRAAFRSQTSIQMIERGHQGPDHPVHFAIPETDYLKAVFVRKLSGKKLRED